MLSAANIITACRIVGSLILLPLSLPSVGFRLTYLLCGLSDMIDGTVARKTNGATAFGAKLDTAADFTFFAVSICKLYPILHLPAWLWVWASCIFAVKIGNLCAEWLCRKTLLSRHTRANKLTGLLLFLLPLTVTHLDIQYTAPIVCTAATVAAIQESIYLIQNRQTDKNEDNT